jgi:putative endonuclease
MQPLPHCVYVLRSLVDVKFYVGRTTDLERRLREHEDGRSPATAPRRPLELVFCEFYRNGADAARREAYLKTDKGKRTLRLMLGSFLAETDGHAANSHAAP